MRENSPVHQGISDLLAQEPEEFKTRKWYDFLFMPFRIMTYLIRMVIFTVAVPAAWFIKPNIDKEAPGFLTQSFNYRVPLFHRPGKTACSMIMSLNKTNILPASERKLVIMFGGNCMDARNTHNCFADAVGETLQRGKSIDNDFLTVGFPKYTTSEREIVDAAVIAILKAIKAGFKVENITITGHSLGGAVAALALRKIKEEYPQVLNGQKFAGYVNHRSFTSISEVVSYERRFLPMLGWMLDITMDAELAVESGLPVRKQKFYRDIRDEVIPISASMAASMTVNLRESNNDSQIPTTVKVTSRRGHNGPVAESLFKPSKEHNPDGKKRSPNYCQIIRSKRDTRHEVESFEL